MNEILQGSLFFGFFLTLVTYLIGIKVQKKLPYTIFNPLLIAILLSILVLKVFKIDFETYNAGAGILTYFMTPITVCLAIPMYKQMKILRKNLAAILVSIFCGCMAAAITIYGLCRLFQLNGMLYHSLQPKSITSAIAMGLSEEMGGNPTLTILAVTITGILGGMIIKPVCRLCHVTNPIAIGLACGNASHAVGTSKALEMGEVEGAMSSLAIVIAGVITVLVVPFFTNLIA